MEKTKVEISDESREFYAKQSSVTDPKELAPYLDNLPKDIPQLCKIVQGLITHRDESDLYGTPLTDQRKQEGETRYVSLILKRILELDNSNLGNPRSPDKRFAGTCRDFAILLCAILRHQNVPARLRCGFAGYFEPEKFEDHWVCEYWDEKQSKWILVDAEVDDVYRKKYKIDVNVFDIPRDQFLVAGQAWNGAKEEKYNPDLFGVSTIDIHGLWFIRSNVVRDLAAINKVEVLPWDYWGLSDKKFEELTEDELQLVDKVATATSPEKENFAEVKSLYQDPRLQVPQVVRSYTTYGGEQMVTLN